jgi:capsular exopolysaccharide synthesis family protein
VGAPAKGGRGREAVVLLMTSALPGAGKTTTVANLAAVMAEAGRRVLVLSLDLRNPTLHEHFNQPNGTGISELLSADRGRHLAEVVHETDVPGVSIATSGHDTDHPGAVLASVRPLIAAARTLADVVIIDAPPMLVVSDALDVARHADVTLLVSKLNKTTRSQAEECQRLFTRFGVSALGTVLVGSRPAGARYGYPTVRTEPHEEAGPDPVDGIVVDAASPPADDRLARDRDGT